MPGKLIVVEGIDGSGKSTQISLLSHWLRSQGYAVAFSEWNSSPLVRQTTRRGKKKARFTPTTFSLIHATDFADRLESYILPLLKAGAIVCADRYAYTAFARDVARGVSRRWVRNLYSFALRPNLAFYFRVPLDVALGRILGGRDAIKYYEAGMDLGLSRDVEESFRIFQGRILDEYEAMAREMGFHVIDATLSIEEQQRQMRQIVIEVLGPHLESRRSSRLKEPPVATRKPLQFYSEPLPGVDTSELHGKLIVIEGPDAVGRTTQIARLRQWLEQEGHAVLDTRHGALRARRQGHPGSQERQHPGPHHHDAVLHHGFRRPPGERDHPRPARRLRGPDRPLHLLDHGARHRARRGPQLDRTGGRLRAGPARGLLPARRRPTTWSRRVVLGPRRFRLLGKRHGPALRPRHVRELRSLPDPPDQGARFHGASPTASPSSTPRSRSTPSSASCSRASARWVSRRSATTAPRNAPAPP